ncbi:GPI anchored dioxygenase [Pyrenophora seminiperda CCB06]|uniref:GPI anchored dioxygenase n=1 Tax=Pyrenophora seminiperda CCB06 TaxID=1302712 RepID=A0A3M7M433_9PLEO|nr:GPI anchored dioxygenase [Pyrenophora seminiperda CCB06]
MNPFTSLKPQPKIHNMVRISHMTAAFAATLLTWTNAHPGEHIDPVADQREADLNKLIAARGAQKLEKCSTSPKARALQQRAIARRAASVNALKPVSKRSVDEIKKYEQVKHNFTGSLSQHSSLDKLFAKDTSSILMPEEILGPYWISGETMRKNCTEGQPGIPMTFELQFIDVNTCEPVPGLWIDVWSANATGDYSGIDDRLDTTYLRGVQISDEDGVTTFNSLVPGHYSGRATHTHVLVHGNVTTFANGTYTSGITRHVGQLYYDEGLRAAVEAVAPYITNTIPE